MIAWWNSLGLLEQIFALVAIPSTILLILQTVLTLFSSFADSGTDAHADADTDIDGGISADHEFDSHVEHDTHHHEEYDSGVRIFTVRGFVAFFSVFGWSGLLFMRMKVNYGLSVFIAFMLGLFFMLLIAYLFSLFFKLQESGNIDINSAVGLSGTVYIKIPSLRSGTGKINAVVSGRYSEFDAMTDDVKEIPVNSAITVVGVTASNILLVVKK